MNAYKFFGAALGVIGFLITEYYSEWLVAVGVFLIVWGNDVERSSSGTRYRKDSGA